MNKDFNNIILLLKPYKTHVVIISIGLLLYAILETASIASFYPLLQSIMSGNNIVGNEGKILAYISYLIELIPIQDSLIASSLMLFFLTIISQSVGLIAENGAKWFHVKLMEDYQNKVFTKMLNNKYGYYLNKKQGELIYIGLNASQSVGEVFFYVPKLSVEFFRMITIIILLLSISAEVTMLFLFLVLFFGVFIRIISQNIIRPLADKIQDNASSVTSIFSESINGVRQIKISDSMDLFIKRFSYLTYIRKFYYIKRFIAEDILKKSIYVIGVSCIVFVIIVLKQYYTSYFIQIIPLVGIYVLALQRMLFSISSVSRFWIGMKTLAPRMDILINVLSNQKEDQKEGLDEFSHLEKEIIIKNLSFSYLADKYVINNINIFIPKGQTIGIVGESGSGKSTLVDIFVRLFEPTSGSIMVDGKDYLHFKRSSWLNNIAMVSQDSFIFHSTIRENIIMGKVEYTNDQVRRAAKIANANDFIMELPEGYDTVVGDRGIKLSGGQRQRIAIARAIILDPDILLLDEATSALDNISELKVQNALYRVRKNRTTLVIAHRLSTIENVDKIYFMENGKIIEEGNHAELLKSKGEYFSMYHKQLMGERTITNSMSSP